MLNVAGLRKSYGGREVVSEVGFEVTRGEIVGLLGPNGAGKTTTVAMICGLVVPDAGRVLIDGRTIGGDADPTKKRIGLAPQELALYEDLSAQANLMLFGSLYGLDGEHRAARVANVLKLVGLTDRAADKVGQYSGGMKRRLNIACALVHEPDIVILDEPTVGVDPQSRNAIFDNLVELRASGKAILYTTHYMEEAERLCDRIVIVDKGRVIANDSLGALLTRLPVAAVIEIDLDGSVDAAPIRNLPGVREVNATNGRLTVGAMSVSETAPALFDYLARQPCTIRHVSTGRANLEQLFLSLTGRQLRD
ncbi:MAG TPA: ABC transporter ATP-binding protein [Burkholderiaceae bacterium]|nr:ABC transporter ATP-binding protein [Burkholderiaceae bacterium]